MSKWKCEICNSEFDNFQAQGFNHQIYCPLCYFKELYKREKSKNAKAIEYFKYQLDNLNFYEDTKAKMLCAMGITLLQEGDKE